MQQSNGRGKFGVQMTMENAKRKSDASKFADCEDLRAASQSEVKFPISDEEISVIESYLLPQVLEIIKEPK